MFRIVVTVNGETQEYPVTEEQLVKEYQRLHMRGYTPSQITTHKIQDEEEDLWE